MDFKHIIVAVVFIAVGYYAGTKGWLSKVTGAVGG
jgi:hypothetical protein